MINDRKDRLGYYTVGFKKFYSKSLALLENNKHHYGLKWHFNDQIYKNINWGDPIGESLEDLYKIRAKQLREQYDYLVLYFSGGADSLNILYAFLKNNIFIDEIVIQYPKIVESKFNESDKSNKNFYSEIKYQAIPVLNSWGLHPLTKVRHQDISDPLLTLFDKDTWFEQMPLGTNISPAGIGRGISQLTEPHIIDLCLKGKRIAQILGVDKPLVISNGDDYYAYFSDLNAMHCPPVDFTQSEIFNELYNTEFFYWTPDLPQIVVKQAQLIKSFCEINAAAKEMMMKSMVKHIKDFRPLLHSLIYPNEIKVNWDPEKPTSKIIRPMDEWFWNTASDVQKGNYLGVIKFLKENTDQTLMINNDISNGFSAHNSDFYKI